MDYLKGVTSIEIDKSKCINCLKCIEVCPRLVFEASETLTLAHKDKCIECGGCQMNCPVSAITVQAGVGCAQAVIYTYLKHTPLGKFFKSEKCC